MNVHLDQQNYKENTSKEKQPILPFSNKRETKSTSNIFKLPLINFLKKISEAFNKCFVADFIFSLARTAEDKNTNSGRMYIAKNRNGPDGLVFPIFMDTTNVQIKVLAKVDTPAVNPSMSPKELADNLKEFYNYSDDLKSSIKEIKNELKDTNLYINNFKEFTNITKEMSNLKNQLLQKENRWLELADMEETVNNSNE